MNGRVICGAAVEGSEVMAGEGGAERGWIKVGEGRDEGSVTEGGETSSSIVGGGARVESDADSSSYPSYSSSSLPSLSQTNTEGSSG